MFRANTVQCGDDAAEDVVEAFIGAAALERGMEYSLMDGGFGMA